MPTLDAYRWLTGDEAEPWLLKVAGDLAGKPPLPAAVRALRSQLGPDRAAAVLDQVELRGKAREKFSRADDLFFARRGLEQATDEWLASYKSQRFVQFAEIADLCCGIGGDAMALSQDHAVDLVDRDEIALLLAAANVERCGGMLGRQIADSVDPRHVSDAAAWHIDPDRRASGRRTSRLELGDPGIETIDALLERCSEGAIKLAPAADLPPQWRSACQREWIETRGECRQQVAWFGRLAEGTSSTATLVDASGEACSFSGTAEVSCVPAARIGAYMFDPSPSLSASRLVGALAEGLGLLALSPNSGFLTGDEPVMHPHLQTFAVEHELPVDVRQLRSHLQARRVGTLEIKKRGVAITPEALRRRLDLAGDESTTLIVARWEGSSRAILCRRIVI
jgi:hypothetical protein